MTPAPIVYDPDTGRRVPWSHDSATGCSSSQLSSPTRSRREPPGIRAAEGRRQRAASFLEAAAELVATNAGLNVLDAFGLLYGDDEVRSDAYYALLSDLAPHVELLGPWSDAETSDRVAHRCRRAAKELRDELRVRRLG
jgi:hypothetical protein